MKTVDVVRAWKDPEYRLSLSEQERESVPPNPAGILELRDADLEAAVGGETARVVTFGCCEVTYVTCSFKVVTFGCCPPETLPIGG